MKTGLRRYDVADFKLRDFMQKKKKTVAGIVNHDSLSHINLAMIGVFGSLSIGI